MRRTLDTRTKIMRMRYAMSRPRSLPFGDPDPSYGKRCGNCAHFTDAPQVLEESFKGINSLSSVYGCSRGNAGICLFHNRYLLPVHSCPDFLKKA
ncbi:MAG TPA: hypothetical protein DDY86_06430 [Syntrophaceae bacterium]|nr:hypothetical protein [Syntrophaceae bacterium]